MDIVSQKQISCDFVYFLCLSKMKKTFGRFRLEAPRAYKCKQILGLCHLDRYLDLVNFTTLKLYPILGSIVYLVIVNPKYDPRQLTLNFHGTVPYTC